MRAFGSVLCAPIETPQNSSNVRSVSAEREHQQGSNKIYCSQSKVLGANYIFTLAYAASAVFVQMCFRSNFHVKPGIFFIIEYYKGTLRLDLDFWSHSELTFLALMRPVPLLWGQSV